MMTRPGCEFRTETTFSLRVSAAPIAWAASRSPRSAIAGTTALILDREGEDVVLRRVSEEGTSLVVSSSVPRRDHAAWLEHTFRAHDDQPAWSDPVILDLADRYPGLRSFTDGSLFAGLVTSVIGQSISIASAMAVQRRLALSFHPGIEVEGRIMAPLPSASQLADASLSLIRASGVTWKRAEGLQTIAREAISGNLPSGEERALSIVERDLVKLPMVGPWTAASALLWGIGAPDAYPKGDVALLRAARVAYDRDDMTMRDLDALSESWQPYRAIATRLLWTGLLGPGWE